MGVPVILTPQSQSDLASIVKHIARDSQDRARAFGNLLIDKALSIKFLLFLQVVRSLVAISAFCFPNFRFSFRTMVRGQITAPPVVLFVTCHLPSQTNAYRLSP